MQINWTFVGQTIEFIIFVWLCLKFIWPPIMSAIEDRQKDITEGLEAAEKGKKSLEIATNNAKEQIKQTKKQVAEIIDQANKRKTKIIDDAKQEALEERNKILSQAKEEIESEVNRAREKLRREISELAVLGARKIVEKNIDSNATSNIIDDLISKK